MKGRRTLALAAVALAALLVSAGCSRSDEQATPVATTTAADSHNMADVMFVQHMIPHHQQAIEMSDLVLAKQGIDARVTQMASQIKAAQGPEIEKMQTWQRQWGMPAMPSGDMGMPGHGNMPGHGDMPMMQGMVSEADMAALRNAQGVEADKLFLTHMIAHHEGAITMAQNEIDHGGYQPTVELARSIITAQRQEIDTMKQILASL